MTFKAILKNARARPWSVGGRTITGNPTPAIMGIVNVTPDSFFDGGRHNTTDLALEHALMLLDQGATILDIGGESSRPGSTPVPEAEELARVLPLVQKLFALTSQKSFFISIDTVKSQVAKQTMKAGAHIVNDISALRFDSKMANVIYETGASSVLNHMRGNFGTMQQDFEPYQDVVADVRKDLLKPVQQLVDMGVHPSSICLDPGIGFGKTLQNNLDLIAATEEYLPDGYPLLLGMSRKGYIGKVKGLEQSDRLIPTVVSGIFAALGGATVIRVHDVREAQESLTLLEAFRTDECV
ncbi:MAG: dihydropteroate synthase [Fibrobacteres bacterium CG2_30_45_31]|nr:MAG: dihydropteroate synthase [Fibrobacteres bacterium CG2_30_45_31]